MKMKDAWNRPILSRKEALAIYIASVIEWRQAFGRAC